MDKVVSFEALIPKGIDLKETMEGIECEKRSLMRVDDLKASKMDSNLDPILLVEDSAKSARVKML